MLCLRADLRHKAEAPVVRTDEIPRAAGQSAADLLIFHKHGEVLRSWITFAITALIVCKIPNTDRITVLLMEDIPVDVPVVVPARRHFVI